METNEDQIKKENRKLALNYLKDQITKFSSKALVQMSKPEIGIGDKTFTAEQLVEEAEGGTEEGNWFLDMIYASKLEKGAVK